MRKFLAILLAFYVLALVMDPCADSERSCSITAPSHSDHPDMCSPFCTCSCCSLSMETASPVVLPCTPVCRQIPLFFIDTQLASYFVPSIWEPPKV